MPAHLPSFHLWTSSDLQTIAESFLELETTQNSVVKKCGNGIFRLQSCDPRKGGFWKVPLLNIKQKYPGHTDMVETEGKTNL